uniref:Endoplasmic reticulum junction formation protein lunapark n=1 Tax=Angiostrongylus cantonensis TaxID=6313 RepID=A0A0K0D5Q0_ANGCA
LDKYDEQIPKMESIPRTLCGQLENSGSNELLFSKPAHTKNVLSEATPREDAMVRPRVQPIRSFQKESVTLIDKMVDYFFGDGPSQRYALICMNCHGHNGMALPVEYEYLAFVCFICGHFNPARKFKSSSNSACKIANWLAWIPSSFDYEAIFTKSVHSQLKEKITRILLIDIVTFPPGAFEYKDSPGLGTALLDNDGEPEKTIVKEIKPDDSFDDLSEEHVDVLESISNSS